jgi:chemotaxis protein CheY-P-specific phosphatase CheC
VDITFAANGFEAIEQIKAGNGDVLLLDLNMPEMDGYQVLEAIVREDLPTLVIVISGDIQPLAHKRVTSLGALGFIKKPVNKDILREVLIQYGIMEAEPPAESSETFSGKQSEPVASNSIDSALSFKAHDLFAHSQVVAMAPSDEPISSDFRDCFQEVANVSMGRAGDLLARLLNAFVVLPIPNVNLIEVGELSMALNAVEHASSTSGICQGFIGSGVCGEALLILNDSSFKEVAALMNYHGQLNPTVELELLMDLANVLIGSCLKGISEQLDMHFSQGHPVVLGQHCNIPDLISTNKSRWRRTLAIEISYGIEGHSIKCDLLLLFSEDSMDTLYQKASYLLD